MIWYDIIWYDMILENFIIWYHMTSYDIIWHRYHIILSYDMILENLLRTNRQTNKQTENSKPEATLIPVDRWGERANKGVLWWNITIHYITLLYCSAHSSYSAQILEKRGQVRKKHILYYCILCLHVIQNSIVLYFTV